MAEMRRVRALVVFFCLAGVGLGGLLTYLWAVTPSSGAGPRQAKNQTEQPRPANEEDSESEPDPGLAVKVIRPRQDRSFHVTVQQLALVEPYYQADLRSRVAGVVKYVRKDIGDPVEEGEVLLEIDAPDLQRDVEHKASLVEQKRREWLLSQANLKTAQAVVEVYRTTITQREAETKQAVSARELKQTRLTRFEELLTRRAVNEDVVDEQRHEAQAAQAALDSSHSLVLKAKADLREKEAMLQAALLDVELKAAAIDVARNEMERVAALAGYARIRAPFKGTITKRNVDPGMFVHAATSGSGEPLVRVARTDIVTVVTKLPDSVAASIRRGMAVTVTIDELTGEPIEGKVTRVAPSIDSNDRTLRVEVDLFNSSRADYAALVGRRVGIVAVPLVAVNGPSAFLLSECSQFVGSVRRKGMLDGLPLFPTGIDLETQRLVPGMTGSMTVHMDRFKETYLLPASSVYSRGGKTYLLLVRDGVTQQVPVHVQANDGRVVKVVLVTRRGTQEVVKELSGTEKVVASRQLEIGEGQTVHVSPEDW